MAEAYLAGRITQRRAGRSVRTALAIPISVDKIGFAGDALAEELRDAKAFYQGKGRPIPQPVRGYLSCHFDRSTLDRVRYVVDSRMITLNGIINNIQLREEPQFAVVVDNIIVFGRTPSSNGKVWFWAQ